MFLQAVPITDASIRQRIIQGAAGVPFCLDLQVDHYETLLRQNKTLQAPATARYYPRA
jgi:hypothetical protein